MRFQGKSKLAILAVMDLAVNHRKGLVTIAEISEHLKVSLSYLEQLFAELRKADLVKGTRGPGGGYELAKDIDQISVYQIINAVDDKAIENIDDSTGYLPSTMWNHLAYGLNQYLKQITLEDLLKRTEVETSVTLKDIELDTMSDKAGLVAA